MEKADEQQFVAAWFLTAFSLSAFSFINIQAENSDMQLRSILILVDIF